MLLLIRAIHWSESVKDNVSILVGRSGVEGIATGKELTVSVTILFNNNDIK